MAHQARAKFRVLALAYEADGGQRGLLLVLLPLADISHQRVHQVRPLISGQLDGGNSRDDLSGGLAGLSIGRREGLEGELLHAGLGILVRLLKPFRLQLGLTGEFASGEGIFQGKAGGGPDVTLCIVVCELLNEGGEI
jgi:hypothetical protein